MSHNLIGFAIILPAFAALAYVLYLSHRWGIGNEVAFRNRYNNSEIELQSCNSNRRQHRYLILATSNTDSSRVSPGTLFVHSRRTRFPTELTTTGSSYGYWRIVSAELHQDLDMRVATAGWNLVNCSGRINGAAIGVSRARTEERALRRILNLAVEHSCHAVAIVKIELWQLFGLWSASITAQPLRLKRSVLER